MSVALPVGWENTAKEHIENNNITNTFNFITIRIIYVTEFFKVATNVLQLKEVGDFYHICWYEEPLFD